MYSQKKKISVALLDDSIFYNKMITHYITSYIQLFEETHDIEFEILSFTKPTDLLQNLRIDLDLAFIDYYLDDEFTGDQIIDVIEEKCPNCRTFLLSQADHMLGVLKELTGDCPEYIRKDKSAINKVCYYIDSVVKQKEESFFI